MTASPKRCRLVVLISGNGSNLQAILDACAEGSLPAEVALVISNRPDAGGIARARQAGVAVEVLDHKTWPDRESFDLALAERIEQVQPDLVVLAGFMRILSPGFVRRFSGRLLNIHPSLLPLYPGLNTHQRALDAGALRHGASVHFVTEELDGGPVLVQAWVPVLPADDAAALATRVLEREHVIYPAVIRAFADRRLGLERNHALLDGQPLLHPIQLAPEDPPPF